MQKATMFRSCSTIHSNKATVMLRTNTFYCDLLLFILNTHLHVLDIYLTKLINRSCFIFINAFLTPSTWRTENCFASEITRDNENVEIGPEIIQHSSDTQNAQRVIAILRSTPNRVVDFSLSRQDPDWTQLSDK